MAIEDVPKRRRSQQRSRGIPISTETTGALLVLAGFLLGFYCMVVDLGQLAQYASVLSIGLVVVGVVLAIAGKQRG
jgi:hypothetical protein